LSFKDARQWYPCFRNDPTRWRSERPVTRTQISAAWVHDRCRDFRRRPQWRAGRGNAPSPYYGLRTAPRWEGRYGSCAITCRRRARSDRFRPSSNRVAPGGLPPNRNYRRDDAPARPPGTRRALHAHAGRKEIKPARMRLCRRLGAHPGQDFFGIGEEGKNRGRRGGDPGLALRRGPDRRGGEPPPGEQGPTPKNAGEESTDKRPGGAH